MSITTTTGLFYAYAKNINDDWSYRYLITFSTRDVADTWYRLVTDSATKEYPRFKSVNRVSLQFYTHNPAEGNIPDTITDPKVAQELRGKMFFTLINDRDGRIQSMIPVLNYTEHTSGNRFFIRSSSQPDTYWYYDPSTKYIAASQTRRTGFTIKIADQDRGPGTTIIGTDEVFLFDDSGARIGVADSGGLLGPGNSLPVKFSRFSEKEFRVDYDGAASASASVLGLISLTNGGGEKWELV